MLKKYEENDIQAIANTIREKTGTDKTYDTSEMPGGVGEVFVAGRGDVLANSKYIEKSAIGKIINLTDVSGVYHKIKVFGDNCVVDVYGKNMFDANTNNWGTYYASNNYRYGFEIPSGFTMINLSATRKSGYEVKTANMTLYRVDGDEIYTQLKGASFTEGGNVTFTLDATKKHVLICLSTTTPSILATLIDTFDWQLEVGSLATPYEPFTKQTITATPLGTEIPSMCPNMNFFADVDITVDYYSSFGIQTEYDRFWDSYQAHGTRTNYANAFAGLGWTDETFKPKYDIVLIAGAGGSIFNSALVTDIGKSLKDCGVTLDTSRATNISYGFANVKTKTLPKLDFSSATVALTDTLANCTELHTTDELAFSEQTNIATSTFRNCSKLTHCIFSGVIASDINLQWSPLLDEESLQSLTQTLADFIMVENNPDGTNIQGQPFTKTLTLSPESWAILDNLEFIPPEGSSYPTGFSCATIITTAKGWNRA